MSEYFYKFDEPLLIGMVKSRPNRFIAICDVGGVEVRAHCPTTGGIGGFSISGMPCLLSKAPEGANRSTDYTLEAISPWGGIDGDYKWLGINQSRVNRYVEKLFELGRLNFIDVVGVQAEAPANKDFFKSLAREPRVGDSKLDFLINGELLVEVKTPLRNIYAELPKDLEVASGPTIGTERMLRQLGVIQEWLTLGNSALLLTVFMYDALRFTPPVSINGVYGKTTETVGAAASAGLRFYQLNLELDQVGVKFTKTFKL